MRLPVREERLEDAEPHLFRHSDPGVGDAQQHLVAARPARESEGSPIRHRLQAVGDEIVQGAHQPRRVDVSPGRSVRLQLDRDTRRLEAGPERAQCLLEDVDQAGVGALQRRGLAREPQQVAGDIGKSIDLGHDRGQVATRRVVLHAAAVEQIGQRPDGGERASQIVHHGARHLPDREGPLGPDPFLDQPAVLDGDRGQAGQGFQQLQVEGLVRKGAPAVEVDDPEDVRAGQQGQAENNLEPQPHDAVADGSPRGTGQMIAVHRAAGTSHLFRHGMTDIDAGSAPPSARPGDEPSLFAQEQKAALGSRESNRPVQDPLHHLVAIDRTVDGPCDLHERLESLGMSRCRGGNEARDGFTGHVDPPVLRHAIWRGRAGRANEPRPVTTG